VPLLRLVLEEIQYFFHFLNKYLIDQWRIIILIVYFLGWQWYFEYNLAVINPITLLFIWFLTYRIIAHFQRWL
jgi:hypothetical protein